MEKLGSVAMAAYRRAASAATWPASSLTKARKPVISLSSEYSLVLAAERGETITDAAV